MKRPEIHPFPIYDLARATVIGIAAHPIRSGAVLATLLSMQTSPQYVGAEFDQEPAPSADSLWIAYGSNVWDEMIKAGYTPQEIISDLDAFGPLPEPFLPQWWTPNAATVQARNARLSPDGGVLSGAQVGSTQVAPMAAAYNAIAESMRVNGVLTAEAAAEALWWVAQGQEAPAFDASDFPTPEAFWKFPRPSVDMPYLSSDTSCVTEHYAKPAGIIAGMAAIAAYEHLLQDPAFSQYRMTVITMGDMVSGDHKTHQWGDKVDISSAFIPSGGGAFDGPVFNMDSASYDRNLTQAMVMILLGSKAPDGGALIEHIEFSDRSIAGTVYVSGHRQHAHLDARVDGFEEMRGQPIATPNTGSWCQYEDVWATWDQDLIEVDHSNDPMPEQPALPPPPVDAAPVPVPDPVQFVNGLAYQLGDPGPFTEAYRTAAAYRGWGAADIEAWLPFALDVAGKESGYCWNVLRGAELTGAGCELITQGSHEDAGFGQIIKLHLPMLCSEVGICTTEEIIASPWNSMVALLKLIETYGEAPWCYPEANGYHSCELAP